MGTPTPSTGCYDPLFDLIGYTSGFAATLPGIEAGGEAARLTPLLMAHFGAKVAPEVTALGALGKNVREISSFLSSPAKIRAIAKNVETLVEKSDEDWDVVAGEAWDTLVSGARLLPPLCDGAQVLHNNKIFQFTAPTMTLFSRIHSAATAFFALDWMRRDVVEFCKGYSMWMKEEYSHPFSSGQHYELRQEWAFRKMGLALADLAKAISYVAMAAITLLATFFTMPSAPLWILAASTSALFFTLITEFAERSLIEYLQPALEINNHYNTARDQVKQGLPTVCLNVIGADRSGWAH
ncbi:MAG: hypothetical protein HYX48_08155 [Chlamydiales bacterium]|nr:hypothetical protein [Chlamydiales bacterium]